MAGKTDCNCVQGKTLSSKLSPVAGFFCNLEHEFFNFLIAEAVGIWFCGHFVVGTCGCKFECEGVLFRAQAAGNKGKCVWRAGTGSQVTDLFF